MGRDNNNAGMHFIRHSTCGNCDDLAYYDKNSLEGISNKQHKALEVLESYGIFSFTNIVGSIQVDTEKQTMYNIVRYEVYSYDKKDELKLHSISTKNKLYECGRSVEDGIAVRVHDTQKKIYIVNTIDLNYLQDNKIYKLKSIYRS